MEEKAENELEEIHLGKDGRRNTTALALKMQKGTTSQGYQEPLEGGKGKEIEFQRGTKPC